MVELTRDTFLNGRLILYQARNGYRFSIDAVLLASAVQPGPGDKILDLGTGCGIIPLILAFRHPTVRIHGVEVQPELVLLAQKNIFANNMGQRIEIVAADMRHMDPKATGGPFDWVVSNPPYRAARSGRVNPVTQKALARHEIMVDLPLLLDTARRMVRTGGRFATIYPAGRLVDLVCAMRAAGIEPKGIQSIHSREGQGAKLVLAWGIKGGRPGLDWGPPLVVYRPDGDYSDAVRKMISH